MKTLFKRANVLSMKTDQIDYATDVLVENCIIASVGRNLPEVADRVIDCTGKYLMPGLFDSHAHFNTSEMGELFIANGVTSIRHMSGSVRVQEVDDEIRSGKRIGPNIYSSSPIYDGAQSEEKNSSNIYLSTVAEAEQAVYDTIAAGYRWVKTYSSLSPDQYQQILKTAGECGIKVCGHMSYFVDAKTLCDWGYHCCEHSSSLPRHDADIEYIAKAGMWFCPTQVVCETLPDYVWNGKQLADLEYYAYVPGKVRAFWEERNQKIIQGYKKRGLRPDINTIIHRGVKFMEHSDRYLAGSDTMYPAMIAGFSLHDELEKLVTLYGCSNYQALKAATANPAEYIGLEDEKGRINKGMDADLVLLEKNPLADIRSTRSIHAVMQGGQLFDCSQIQAMLEHVCSMTDDEIEFFSPLL